MTDFEQLDKLLAEVAELIEDTRVSVNLVYEDGDLNGFDGDEALRDLALAINKLNDVRRNLGGSSLT